MMPMNTRPIYVPRSAGAAISPTVPAPSSFFCTSNIDIWDASYEPRAIIGALPAAEKQRSTRSAAYADVGITASPI